MHFYIIEYFKGLGGYLDSGNVGFYLSEKWRHAWQGTFIRTAGIA